MKKYFIVLLLALATTIGVRAQGCDTVQLPYSANFTQCWTAAGGATIIDSNHASINGPGQTLTSPWFEAPAGCCYVNFEIIRDYSDNYWYNWEDSSASFGVYFQTESGSQGSWWWVACQNQSAYGEFFYSEGGRYRLVLCYDDENPVHLMHVTNFTVRHYPWSLTMTGPDAAYLGDTVTIAASLAMPVGDTIDNSYFSIYHDWNWLGDGDSFITILAATDTSRTVVFHSTGEWEFYFSAYKNNYHISDYKYINVYDTVTVDCDSVVLPYRADFTQCWTAENGATIIDPNHASITSQGQKLTSPWMDSEAGTVYLTWVSSCDDDVWNESTYYTVTVETESGAVLYTSDYQSYSTWWIPSFTSPGGRIRVTFERTGAFALPSFRISDVAMVNYEISLTLDGPTTADIGDTVTFTAHVSLPDNDTWDYWNWWLNCNGYWIDDNSGGVTLIASTDSSRTYVFHTPGNYRLFTEIQKYNEYIWQYISYQVYSDFLILDTIDLDCDNISLPYTVDFTQCWTAENGATIIDPYHAQLEQQGQRIVGPWMQSEPGKSYLYWTGYNGIDDWDDNKFYTLIVESQQETIWSYQEPSYNGPRRSDFTSPGGMIRVVFEYIGNVSQPSFQVGNVVVFKYDIEASIDAPEMARVGDTVTINLNITKEDDRPVYSDIRIYNQNLGYPINWTDGDTSITVLSQDDNSLTLVWNVTGNYMISTWVYAQDVYLGHYADADASQWLRVYSSSVYTEDSIYYSSTAKDTVIGCHPQLHTANLPASVRCINDSAFFNLPNLSVVNLPDGLVRIGYMAFAWNQGITEITLPRGLKYVGDNAFWWDTNLTTVNFNADSCIEMCRGWHDGDFYPVFIGCNNLTTVNFGDNVKYIPAFAFSNCPGLRGRLVIPDSVRKIGKRAFYHYVNNWTEGDTLQVVLSASLYNIGDTCFPSARSNTSFNQKLTSVISRNPVPPVIHAASFYLNPDIAVLTVPCGTTETYRGAYYWYEFTDIREDCDGIDEPVGADDDIHVYALDGRIVVEGANGEPVSVFDVMGLEVSGKRKVESGKLEFAVPQTGVYLVRVGDRPARKVVIVR